MKLRHPMGLIAAAALATTPALAGHGRDRTSAYVASGFDYAQVVDVDPLIRQVKVVTPREECFTETRYEPDHRYGGGGERAAAGPMILGGLLGAVIGNQIGHRDTRRHAAIAGAVIGTAIGHDAAARRASVGGSAPVMRPVDTQRCEVHDEERIEERVDGYRVTYQYHGKLYTTQLPYDPGERLRVRVSVDPA